LLERHRAEGGHQRHLRGQSAPNPYAISLLGAENDYSVLRPLSVSLGLSPGKGVLRLSPNATQDEPYLWTSGYPIPGTLQSATFEGIEVQTPRGGTAYSMTYPLWWCRRPDVTASSCGTRRDPASSPSEPFPRMNRAGWPSFSPRAPGGSTARKRPLLWNLNQGDSVTLRIANSNSKDRPSSIYDRRRHGLSVRPRQVTVRSGCAASIGGAAFYVATSASVPTFFGKCRQESRHGRRNACSTARWIKAHQLRRRPLDCGNTTGHRRDRRRPDHFDGQFRPRRPRLYQLAALH